MSKIKLEFDEKDWVAVTKTHKHYAAIKITSMTENVELEIEATDKLFAQIVSQILITLGDPFKNELVLRLAQDIVMEKEERDFAENEGDRFYEENHKPEPEPELKPVIYSPGAFAELFNPRV